MDKRLILAFGLSFAVLLAYWVFFPPPKAKAPAQPTASVEASAAPVLTPRATSNAPLQKDADTNPLVDVTLDTDVVHAVFTSQNAELKSFELRQYPYDLPHPEALHLRFWHWLTQKNIPPALYDPYRKVNMVDPKQWAASEPLQFQIGPNQAPLRFKAEPILAENGAQKLRFTATTDTGLRLEKVYRFQAGSYAYSLNFKVTNPTGGTLILTPNLKVGDGNQTIETAYNPQRKVGMTVVNGDYKKTTSFDDNPKFTDFSWAAVTDTYFITGIKPAASEKGWTAQFSPLPTQILEQTLVNPLLTISHAPVNLAANSTWQADFEIYMGPKEFTHLEAFDKSFPESLDLFFNILARPMLHALRWYYSILLNWGLALILLTFTVRLVLFPLAYKGMTSMRRMASLNPRIQYLRKKYEKDKPRLNQEIMQLYKKNKANPVTGCLPMLMQIPIFLSLYWLLLPAIELRQQPFYGWLTDLSSQDPYLVLPLLMGLTMFIQQRVSPPPSNLEPLQQKIMQFFPVVLTLMFVNFPSGLVLYWVTSNTITIIQQTIFNRVKMHTVVE